ncbi:MAG: virulence RhuM family protein [Coriobacteriales bacterium]|nr:virulence RhuM family protein [Coriobacteriales bacterium]
MQNQDLIQSHGSIEIFQTEDGSTEIDALFQNENVWLTQAQMSKLFERERSVITKHIKNAIAEGEIDEKSNVQSLHIANSDKPVAFYNLDVIISVGYRVKSIRGVQFRRWATRILHEYIQKGFALNDDRLRNGNDYEVYYFDELLERIQDIRASERRFYQKITDIFATSIDYDKDSRITQEFFATVQNKLHWAISGQTAAEIVYHRADSSKPNMGLTSWRGNKVRKGDIDVAKNYLSEQELVALNGITEQYLVFAETQARQHVPMRMQDWVERLHAILGINDKQILQDARKISRELAMQKAQSEYKVFSEKRAKTAFESDFDESVHQLGERP